MPDLEPATPDYTTEKLTSPASDTKKEKSPGEKAALSGASKALSGMGSGKASDTTTKENAIADKAASEPGSTESTASPKAAPIQGATLGSFKEGGKVPKTGPYTLHKGETVVPVARKSMYRQIYMDRMKEKNKEK